MYAQKFYRNTGLLKHPPAGYKVKNAFTLQSIVSALTIAQRWKHQTRTRGDGLDPAAHLPLVLTLIWRLGAPVWSASYCDETTSYFQHLWECGCTADAQQSAPKKSIYKPCEKHERRIGLMGPGRRAF